MTLLLFSDSGMYFYIKLTMSPSVQNVYKSNSKWGANLLLPALLRCLTYDSDPILKIDVKAL